MDGRRESPPGGRRFGNRTSSVHVSKSARPVASTHDGHQRAPKWLNKPPSRTKTKKQKQKWNYNQTVIIIIITIIIQLLYILIYFRFWNFFRVIFLAWGLVRSSSWPPCVLVRDRAVLLTCTLAAKFTNLRPPGGDSLLPSIYGVIDPH